MEQSLGIHKKISMTEAISLFIIRKKSWKLVGTTLEVTIQKNMFITATRLFLDSCDSRSKVSPTETSEPTEGGHREGPQGREPLFSYMVKFN